MRLGLAVLPNIILYNHWLDPCMSTPRAVCTGGRRHRHTLPLSEEGDPPWVSSISNRAHLTPRQNSPLDCGLRYYSLFGRPRAGHSKDPTPVKESPLLDQKANPLMVENSKQHHGFTAATNFKAASILRRQPFRFQLSFPKSHIATRTDIKRERERHAILNRRSLN